jgi:hypothetical protein
MKILNIWLKRVQLVKRLRSYIGGILEEASLPFCEFCGNNWGVRAECVENIEELYREFWEKIALERKKELNLRGTALDINEWQKYFKMTANIRTICFFCSKEILDNMEHNLVKLRQVKLSVYPEIKIISPKLSVIEISSQHKQSLNSSRRNSKTEFLQTITFARASSLEELSPKRKPKFQNPVVLDNINRLLLVWRGLTRRVGKTFNKSSIL